MSDSLPIQLKISSGISEISSEAWDSLLDPQAVPFLEHAWLDALEASGSVSPKTGWHPRHLSLWRGSKLVAAAPAYLKDDSHGEFVFDWSWASAAERIGIRYYPKLVLCVPLAPVTGSRILVAPGEDRAARERDLLRGALEFARSEGLSSVHVLFATEAEMGSLTTLGFAERHGVQYQWFRRDDSTFEEFLARFQSKRRNQLHRERRSLDQQRIEVRTLSGKDLASVDPELLYRTYCTTVDKFMWGRRYLSEDFFRRALRIEDRVEWVEARLQGRLIAGAFNVSSSEVLYGRYWGCFEEHPFLHFNVCLYHGIDECLRRGRVRFEPGAGGEHKLVRGFEPTLTYSAHWIFNGALDRAVRKFLEAERAAIRDGIPLWRKETGYKAVVGPKPNGEH